jgi:hypothetical protein
VTFLALRECERARRAARYTEPREAQIPLKFLQLRSFLPASRPGKSENWLRSVRMAKSPTSAVASWGSIEFSPRADFHPFLRLRLGAKTRAAFDSAYAPAMNPDVGCRTLIQKAQGYVD